MGGNIQVPNNIEDKVILKRFLTDLVLGINSNSLFSGNIQEQNSALVEILQNNPTLNFLDIASKLTELRTNILTYVEDNIETVILQNTEDIAVVAEQFGTFYNQALSASWYGLSVKAGGAVAGLEVGSLDPDVTTPGDESSYFRVVANNFILGRAYEDLTQAEKDYLASNNLPSFGTVYNAQKQPVPALITSWDNTAGTYKHYFNGIVQFSNIQGADYANAINNGTTTVNGGKITTNSVTADKINTTGLIAENISSTNITGKNIYSSNLIASQIQSSNGSFSITPDGVISGSKLYGASFNNIRLRFGSFQSNSDNEEYININSTEGIMYYADGSYTTHGNSAPFSRLLGVITSFIGPGSANNLDMNIPTLISENVFGFNRADGFSSPCYFSYIAWGL